MKTLTLLFTVGVVALGVPTPTMIPRAPMKHFVTRGSFQGGVYSHANIETIRMAAHPDQGYERWVIDFSDEHGHQGDAAPPFQLHYKEGDSPSLQFHFRALGKTRLKNTDLIRLTRKSRLVSRIEVYPPVEGGDTAIEWVLKENVQFEPHQPLEKSGRLVVDLKPLRKK